MASWIRRSFGAAGLTQIPPGPGLLRLQRRCGGGRAVMLMIDVSGSMEGVPIAEAVRGAEGFVREAVEARYEVGVLLWNVTVVESSRPDEAASSALAVLSHARAGGGNNLLGPLQRCHEILGAFTDDRVVALFGDGDLTPKGEVLAQVARMKADNIRFVTRGLGAFAAREFGEISDESADNARIDTVEELADGIAQMATALRGRPDGAQR